MALRRHRLRVYAGSDDRTALRACSQRRHASMHVSQWTKPCHACSSHSSPHTLQASAQACGLPQGGDVRPRVPSKAQQSKRLRAAGAPGSEMVFVLHKYGHDFCGFVSVKARGEVGRSGSDQRLATDI